MNSTRIAPLVALVVGLGVAGAEGALINLSWSDTDPNVQTLDLQPGETANLYVWVLDITYDETWVDNINTVFFEYNDAPVEVLGTGVAQPGWGTDEYPGIMGPGVQFGAAVNTPPWELYNLYATDGSDWLIGHQPIQLQDGVFDGVGDYGTMVPITIYGENDLVHVGILHDLGVGVGARFYKYNPSYASASTGIGTYTGYYAFGTGSPNVPATKLHPGQTENPLWIRVVPEPGGLLVLGLGGLAVVRRRRGR